MLSILFFKKREFLKNIFFGSLKAGHKKATAKYAGFEKVKKCLQSFSFPCIMEYENLPLRIRFGNTAKDRKGIQPMKQDLKQAFGKSAGEVLRDIASFLDTSCPFPSQPNIDLRRLPNGLSMAKQLSFALLTEAELQGWQPNAIRQFYRSICTESISDTEAEEILDAFQNKQGDPYRTYVRHYGSEFHLWDASYWATCMALAVEEDQVPVVLQYLRSFLTVLTEFAYMDRRNPKSTYTWTYYTAFQAMLEELLQGSVPPADPLPLKVRAIGGTSGKRNGDRYPLSLGVDIENPNRMYLAMGISLDITLKSHDGTIVDVITDQLDCIDPGTVYHYGITKTISGAAIARISAAVTARQHLKLKTPILQHISLSSAAVCGIGEDRRLTGTLESKYDRPLHSFTLHYQFLSAENTILGGGSEWCFQGIAENTAIPFSSPVEIKIPNAVKIVHSVSFPVLDLIDPAEIVE